MNEQEHTLEREIRTLEEKLREKKHALEGAHESPPSEKEIFNDVFREHIEKAVEGTPPEHVNTTAPRPIPAVPAHDYAAPQQTSSHDSDHKEQISALVEIALSKGVSAAVKVARELKNPHLLDDFHDALVDEYYDKLVKAREIKE
ncbi:MAG: hypothetical protein COU90_00030 [Candidatus Ryanbacteria bacterium CG10_big_fil_rev_8_21_14_0_10_43_42]|uniref:Uncharacterized protein n=1 Tax=Candidatus Ryanbacteria bacterium CG10_big_fil_rev_8_21_14_0_10_43_42 TaxID=1974864 RepID=A0A2M8KY86_9BACT|nr:MAG: hypothetical protein COU90_00030 [Candidatus Ryanbacteria bacterium CG10_big_fil_rev_8_21_14_0_10_43_42]